MPRSLINFRKNLRNKIAIFPRKCKIIKNNGTLSRNEFHLTKTQLNKLNYVAKNKTGTILRLSKRRFGEEDLLHNYF